MRATRDMPSARRSRRRGFTFLEAVLGMALLGILAGAIFGVLGYAWRIEIEGRQTLAAAEVANRVLISYLDDATSPRKLPDTIDYEQARYRWSIDIENVSLRDANPQARRSDSGQPTTVEFFDEMQHVTVVAWLDDGTDRAVAPGRTPTFRIERLVNPVEWRGTDTIQRLLEDQERRDELIQMLVGTGESG